MKRCLLFLIFLTLASCATEGPRSARMYLPAIDGPKIVPIAVLDAATEARVFVFDFGECNEFNIFQKDSERNLVADGIRLTEQQLLVLKLLIPTRVKLEGTMCFNPHHAIAWFDSADKVVASAEICFECDAVQLQIGSDLFGYATDMTLFRDFIESLGAPVSLARTCDRQNALLAPWKTPVSRFCALNSVRLQALKSLPKNWQTLHSDNQQKSCIRNTREVIF